MIHNLYRFLSQHCAMFDLFLKVFGCSFWENCVLAVSHSCTVRQKNNFDSWVEKLCSKFPEAGCVRHSKVFMDTSSEDEETIEELYQLLKNKKEKQLKYPAKSLEDISLTVPIIHEERPRSSLDSPSTRTSSCSPLYSSTERLVLPPSSPRPGSKLSIHAKCTLNHLKTA